MFAAAAAAFSSVSSVITNAPAMVKDITDTVEVIGKGIKDTEALIKGPLSGTVSEANKLRTAHAHLVNVAAMAGVPLPPTLSRFQGSSTDAINQAISHIPGMLAVHDRAVNAHADAIKPGNAGTSYTDKFYGPAGTALHDMSAAAGAVVNAHRANRTIEHLQKVKSKHTQDLEDWHDVAHAGKKTAVKVSSVRPALGSSVAGYHVAGSGAPPIAGTLSTASNGVVRVSPSFYTPSLPEDFAMVGRAEKSGLGHTWAETRAVSMVKINAVSYAATRAATTVNTIPVEDYLPTDPSFDPIINNAAGLSAPLFITVQNSTDTPTQMIGQAVHTAISSGIDESNPSARQSATGVGHLPAASASTFTVRVRGEDEGPGFGGAEKYKATVFIMQRIRLKDPITEVMGPKVWRCLAASTAPSIGMGFSSSFDVTITDPDSIMPVVAVHGYNPDGEWYMTYEWFARVSVEITPRTASHHYGAAGSFFYNAVDGSRMQVTDPYVASDASSIDGNPAPSDWGQAVEKHLAGPLNLASEIFESGRYPIMVSDPRGSLQSSGSSSTLPPAELGRAVCLTYVESRLADIRAHAASN
jgi:hypothetical protein